MASTQVKDIMRKNPVLIKPDATLQDAAEKMRDIECGILPVGTGEKLEGIITDRDIVTRAVSRGKDISKELVKDYMTPEVFCCIESETLENAADKMRVHKVNRLVIKNNEGKVTGILSFGGILKRNDNDEEIASVIKHAVHPAAA